MSIAAPMIALDLVGIVYEKMRGVRALFTRFPYTLDTEAERRLIVLSEKFNIALLADMSVDHCKTAMQDLMPQSYRYVLRCQTIDEYKLFMDSYQPMYMFSNLPAKFGCHPLGAVGYIDKDMFWRMLQEVVPISATTEE